MSFSLLNSFANETGAAWSNETSSPVSPFEMMHGIEHHFYSCILQYGKGIDHVYCGGQFIDGFAIWEQLSTGFTIAQIITAALFLVLFLSPGIVAAFLFIVSFYLFFTYRMNAFKNGPVVEMIKHQICRKVAKLIVFWLELWYGFEIHGLENLPEDGPAILIYYHAAMPVDFFYAYSKVLLVKNRRMKIIADKFLFHVPGLKSGLWAFDVTPGTKDHCSELLDQGHILAISPGGVREALFSSHNYEIIWNNRCGFAEVAKRTKAPIIPMFTQNCRETLRTLTVFRKLLLFIYEKTRLPFVPIYGIFPVKLRTFLGKPIEHDEQRSAEELRELTKEKINELIQRHQRLPGGIFQAFLDRFRPYQPKNE